MILSKHYITCSMCGSVKKLTQVDNQPLPTDTIIMYKVEELLDQAVKYDKYEVECEKCGAFTSIYLFISN